MSELWKEAGADGCAVQMLLASCEIQGVERLGYFRDLLCLLPSWPDGEVLDLAPHNWTQTLERPAVQQQLEANVFRRAELGSRLRAPLWPSGGDPRPSRQR